jgi:hypothetical protein
MLESLSSTCRQISPACCASWPHGGPPNSYLKGAGANEKSPTAFPVGVGIDDKQSRPTSSIRTPAMCSWQARLAARDLLVLILTSQGSPDGVTLQTRRREEILSPPGA